MEAVANTAARPGLDPTSRHATRAASNKPGVAFWEDVVLFETFDMGDPLPGLTQKGGYTADGHGAATAQSGE